MKAITRNELIKELQDVDEGWGVEITLSNDDYWTVEDAGEFIGGEHLKGHYMSDILGNVAYSSVESIADAILEFVESENLTIVSAELS